MRIIKYALGIIAVLAIAFLLIGVFVPTFTYESRVEINAPVEHTFAIFNDESRMGEWLNGFKSIETLSGGPNQVGSKFRLTFVQRGEEMVMLEELTAFKENEQCRFTIDNDVLVSEVDVRFTDNGESTGLAARTTVTGKGAIWKSLLPLFKSMMLEETQSNYGRLKGIVESSPIQELLTETLPND